MGEHQDDETEPRDPQALVECGGGLQEVWGRFRKPWHWTEISASEKWMEVCCARTRFQWEVVKMMYWFWWNSHNNLKRWRWSVSNIILAILTMIPSNLSNRRCFQVSASSHPSFVERNHSDGKGRTLKMVDLENWVMDVWGTITFRRSARPLRHLEMS